MPVALQRGAAPSSSGLLLLLPVAMLAGAGCGALGDGREEARDAGSFTPETNTGGGTGGGRTTPPRQDGGTRGTGGGSQAGGGSSGEGGGGAGEAGGGSSAGGGGGNGGGTSAPDDAGTSAGVCPTVAGAPPGVPPLPSAAQVAYQRTEMTAFIHLGLATYDGTEQGNDAVASPSLFNPTGLDATQWVSALKRAGFRQAMLTTKHSTGFCLWPSKLTDFSVKNSPWKGGQGDVVKDFTDAMHAAGLRVALYLSPWDRHYPSSKADYETYFKNQLAELLSNYGSVYEIEFDGFNAPRGVDWSSVFDHVKKLQANTLVWAGPEVSFSGVDLRWIGNENGQATRTSSSVGTVPNGGPSNVWYPFETNVSDRVPNWFWHENNTVMSLGSMQNVYFRSVGMNTTLNFNIPPNKAGLFDAQDVKLLEDFGAWYSALYKNNLAKAQLATADSTWATAGFEAAKAVDDDLCTSWAAASGKTSGRLEVAPASPITLKLISLREPIELGERSTSYHVEFKQNGTWNRAPTDSSGNTIKGTVIGQRQLWQIASVKVEAVALVIDAAKGVPAIAEFGLY